MYEVKGYTYKGTDLGTILLKSLKDLNDFCDSVEEGDVQYSRILKVLSSDEEEKLLKVFRTEARIGIEDEVTRESAPPKPPEPPLGRSILTDWF